MKFTTYVAGAPTGHYDCPDWEVDIVANGQSYVEGWLTENQYVVDGNVVEKPPRPSSNHVWSWADFVWVLDRPVSETIARNKRNTLLAESDWTQLPDVPIPTKAAWAEYRQALRDITAQPGYPFDIVWPTPPQ